MIITAIDVLAEIIRRNRRISTLRITTFDPDVTNQLNSTSSDRVNTLLKNPSDEPAKLRAQIKQTAIEASDTRTTNIHSSVILEGNESFPKCSCTCWCDCARANEIANIPMIDLEIGPEDMEVSELVLLLQKIFSRVRWGRVLPGYLLVSGNSYHYYGLDLIDSGVQLSFFGACLVANLDEEKTIFDAGFIAHSMMRDPVFPNLRVFASSTQPEPSVVAYIERKELD